MKTEEIMILKKTTIFLLAVLVMFLMPVQGSEIHKAVKDGDLAKVKSLLEKEPKLINAVNSANQTPLLIAAYGGGKELVTYLIDKGASVNQADIYGATPLHMAVLQGHKEIVELLLSKGADMNAKAKNGKVPMQLAFEIEHTGIIELFLTKGVDLSVPINRYGRTLLHKAVIMGKSKVVDLLITKGADINAKDKSGKSALDLATICGHKDVAELLRKRGIAGAVKPALEVTYIANAGFLVSSNTQKQKILIDSLFRSGFEKYPVPEKAVIEDMIKAKEPFDNVHLVMVTHKNIAHFDTALTESYLNNNPRVHFLSSREVALELELYGQNFPKMRLQVLAVTPTLKSGAEMMVDGIKLNVLRFRITEGVEYLGYIVNLGGKTFCHLGDARVKNYEEEFKIFKLNEQGVDVAFILYWDFLDANSRAIIKKYINPEHIVLMHVPTAEVDKVSQEIEKYKKDFPSVTIFKKSLEKKTF